jgi:hypothetical protein
MSWIWKYILLFLSSVSVANSFSITKTVKPKRLVCMSSEYEAIKRTQVISTSSGNNVNVGELWDKDETCIFLCLRSFG